MSELPASRQARLEYFEARNALWLANATAIGITAAQATAIKTATQANRADFGTMEVARGASKAATNTFYTSNNTMTDLGRDLLKTIKAFAQTTNNPAVYSLANIDPPTPPSPVPPPDVPTDLVGVLSPVGVATVSWKSTKSGASSGIFFVVARQWQGEADFTVLGASAEKSFIDPAPNAAAGPVYYRVRAVRGADQSDWTQPIVFNIAGGGGMVAATVAGFSPKSLAA